LIETEQQRRWWFATHPEFSSSRTGHNDDVSGRFGRGPIENPAKDAFIREMAKAGWSREKAEERWKVFRLNENIAQGVADAMTVVGAIGVASNILTRGYRWATRLGELGAIGKSVGPGKWVEVARPWQGLEHQSKMSGQPIIKRDGKFYIKEWEQNGVKFDDRQKGELLEYKDRYTNFIKDGKEFHHWFRGADRARKQALDQVKASEGMPVIWRVGADQVEAFQKAVQGIPVTVKP
jgi:hypothetical protein